VITARRLRFEADKCEHSKDRVTRCHCRCGGSLHGKFHSDVWIDEVLIRERLRYQIDPDQFDWVGFDDYAEYL